MKTRLCLIGLVLALCVAVHSQNVLVNFYPNNQPYPGLTNWPYNDLKTNYTGSVPGWTTNMLLSDYTAYVAALKPVYDAGVSNAYYVTVTANVLSNYNAWYSLYTNIPAGLTDTSNRINVFTNMSRQLTVLNASWNSGTNNAAGTNRVIGGILTNMVIQASQGQYTWTYLNQIINYLSRLGPGLQQGYNPALDPVGH